MTEQRLSAACSTTVLSATGSSARAWAPHQPENEPLSGSAEGFSCLSSDAIFDDLPAQDIAALDRMAPPRKVSSGGLVFSQSQPITALFILKTGRIRIFRVAADGRTRTIAILEPGVVFGEMPLLGQQMYDNYAEAIEDCFICQFSVAEVEEHFLSHPGIAVRIFRLLGEQVGRLQGRLTDLALRPLAARAASLLLTLVEAAPRSRFMHSRAVKLTHLQLAGLLGVTREATSRATADFVARGLIRQGRGRIIVNDLDGLRRISRSTF